MFHGVGANGKSTLVGVVQDLLGSHAMTAPAGLVIAHDHDPHPERIAALRGRRLVVSHELEQQAQLAEQVVKTLTGGDILSARELYGRRFNFTPSHKVVLVTNHQPRVRGTDHAIWRRIRLVPFTAVIPPEQQDRTYGGGSWKSMARPFWRGWCVVGWPGIAHAARCRRGGHDGHR